MKNCLSVVIEGFCFLSWLMETASGVSIRPPVGQVAMMLKGFSHRGKLWMAKMD